MMQTLPHSVETEQALLSSMLAYPSSVQQASELALHPEHFYVEANKRLYKVMMDLYEEGNLLILLRSFRNLKISI